MEGKDWKRRETMKKERYSCTIDLYSNLNHTVYDVRNWTTEHMYLLFCSAARISGLTS
jgi:hypothetical protein